MRYAWTYKTPDGFADLAMYGDDEMLAGLRFLGSRDERRDGHVRKRRETPAFRATCRWLDAYFSGRAPGFTPRYRIEGLTPFRQDVIDAMLEIPFGATVSYGDIAKRVSMRHGGQRTSARAVGGAVGWNPICIIIPCHRVIGADGSLTGYGGGLGNKIALLAHEGVNLGEGRNPRPRSQGWAAGPGGEGRTPAQFLVN